MPLKPGTIAPDFTLPSTAGKNFSLHKEGGPCILYFYPRDFTSGCTREACKFRDTFSFFEELDIPVYGISRDSVTTHLEFKAAYHLPFDLLSDEYGRVSDLYKASIPFLNFTRRVTYLLDKDHRVMAVYENLFAATSHVREMVKFLRKHH